MDWRCERRVYGVGPYAWPTGDFFLRQGAAQASPPTPRPAHRPVMHLASDESSYVFARESEEERVVVAFNNADQSREVQIPLADTPAQKAMEMALLFGPAKATLAGSEIRITMPAQSLSIFTLN